jgi:signal transduction histidine kinase/ActR/RegA family two-component response regulator
MCAAETFSNTNAAGQQLRRLEQRLERQRLARVAAESLLEEKSLALYRVNESLRELTNNLETEIAKQTQELKRALEQAQVATKAKDQFLANLSHEVRTPLNAINGLIQILMRSEVNAQQQEYLSLLEGSAHSLLVLLDDVLDFSKMESGKLLFQAIRFNLSSWINETTAAYQIQANHKGLSFKCHAAPDLPHALIGDPHRLRQVLTNLISNAIKFTAQGGIEVTIARAEQSHLGPNEVRISFVVKDTGIGISPDQQQQIFEAFVQADASITRRFGGTGLGLAIASRLVARMQGDLRVTSQREAGSVFSFEVVLQRDDQALLANDGLSKRKSAAAEHSLKGLNILVAEDHPINQLLMRTMISRLGAQAVIAADGAQAWAAWQQQKFDLILMDIQMPVMSGFEVTEKIRLSEQLSQQRIPIIALTAHAMEGDKERCLASGMDGYVSKPVSEEALCLTVEAVLRARQDDSKFPMRKSNDD